MKMKPDDVESETYIEYDVNDKDFKLKVGDPVRTSKYKTVFVEGYTPN